MCPQYQYYLIMLTQKPICKKQSPSVKEAWKRQKDFGEKTEMGFACNLIARQIWEEPQRSLAVAGDESEATAAQGVWFMQVKEAQGSHLSQGAVSVPSWRPPALPPKPRQKLQGILSVFLALFLRHHMPAADFPLLVAPCTGGAMLTLVTWICSNTMPGKGKASSLQPTAQNQPAAHPEHPRN